MKLIIQTPYGIETAFLDDDAPDSEIQRVVQIALSSPPGNGRTIFVENKKVNKQLVF